MSWSRALAAVGASAVLFALAYPPVSLRPLAFVALAPLFVALRTGGAWRAVLLAGIWAQLTSYLVGDALPASVERYFAQPPLASFGFASLVFLVTASIYFLPLPLVYRRLARRGPGPWLPLGVAAAWAAIELARARLATGTAFWGAPWALFGYSQVGFDPLVQVASLGGTYLVSFVLVAPSAALAEWWLARGTAGARPARTAIWISFAPALLALVYGGVVLQRAELPDPSTEVSVGVVQADVQLNVQWRPEKTGRNLDAYLDQSAELLAGGDVDVVVWSESSMSFHLDRSPAFLRSIARTLSRGDAELLAGGPSGVDGEPPRYHNSVFAVSPVGEITGRYDKQRLVPFGEFVPLQQLDIMRRRFAGTRSFSPGGEAVLLPTRAGPAGVLVCNEAMLPSMAGLRARAGATWLVSPSNDSWIARERWARMTFDLVSMRAVEQRRYLVRASSSGPSGVVDPYGRVLARTRAASEALVSGPVRPMHALSVYGRVGDLFALLCAAMVAIALVAVGRAPKRET